MYGDGLSERSARYSDSGGAANGRRMRCEMHDLHDVAGSDIFARPRDGGLIAGGAKFARGFGDFSRGL